MQLVYLILYILYYLGMKPSDLASSMYQSCANEFHLRCGNAPWCVMFREEDAKTMEYYDDIRTYHLYGYGYPINYEAACNLFSEVFQSIL